MNILFMMEFTNSRSKSCEFPTRLFRLARWWQSKFEGPVPVHRLSDFPPSLPGAHSAWATPPTGHPVHSGHGTRWQCALRREGVELRNHHSEPYLLCALRHRHRMKQLIVAVADLGERVPNIRSCRSNKCLSVMGCGSAVGRWEDHPSPRGSGWTPSCSNSTIWLSYGYFADTALVGCKSIGVLDTIINNFIQ